MLASPIFVLRFLAANVFLGYALDRSNARFNTRNSAARSDHRSPRWTSLQPWQPPVRPDDINCFYKDDKPVFMTQLTDHYKKSEMIHCTMLSLYLCL
jgi:hypothetical protein